MSPSANDCPICGAELREQIRDRRVVQRFCENVHCGYRVVLEKHLVEPNFEREKAFERITKIVKASNNDIPWNPGIREKNDKPERLLNKNKREPKNKGARVEAPLRKPPNGAAAQELREQGIGLGEDY